MTTTSPISEKPRTFMVFAVFASIITGTPPKTVPAEDQRGVDAGLTELMTKSDPLQDDWETEKLWMASKSQLSRLFKNLTQPNDAELDWAAFTGPHARAVHLRPSPLITKTLAGGFRISTWEFVRAEESETVPVSNALQELVAFMRGPDRALRIEFKIVTVQPHSKNEWITEVRYEAYSTGAGDIQEQTAYFNVEWTSKDTADKPLIHSIKLLSYQEVVRERPVFHEVTRDVIQSDWDEQLQLGGEFWYGRIDAVGEINFMGHNGIAIGDANGDGLEDVYVAMPTGLPNKLFIHQPDGTVIDRAEQAGVAWLDDSKGVLFADMDNDGDQDLLCAIGPTIVLCKNDGAGRFDRFVSMRAPTPASFYSLAVADYDLDGDLDIYACRYIHLRYGVSVPMPFHDANNGPTNHLMRNDGNDRFVDVTREVGLDVNNTRFSLAGAWADYDNDGDPDLYVANDFGRNNLYRNDDGHFVDVAATAAAEDQAAGMGASWSDFDLDGDFDLYVSNMFSSAGRRIAYQTQFKQGVSTDLRLQVQRHSLGNTLLKNQGDGTFTDITDSAGVRMGRWSWGSKFVDLNNDGYDDLIVPNGFLTNDRKDDL